MTLIAGLLAVLLAIPLLVLTGVARPNVAVEVEVGSWNGRTGAGSITLRVTNFGLVPVTVVSAVPSQPSLAMGPPVEILAGSSAEIDLDYVMRCTGTMRDELGTPVNEPLGLALRIQGIGPIRRNYSLDWWVDDMLPTREMCDELPTG